MAAHFDPAVSKQLKHLGLERDSSTQALLREAINELFTKYGRPLIAKSECTDVDMYECPHLYMWVIAEIADISGGAYKTLRNATRRSLL